MRKFIADLMTNRFGIVLAAVNVCYFISKNFVNYVFSHGDGERCVFVKYFEVQEMKLQCAEFMLSINLPALAASAIQSDLTQSFFPDFCGFTQAKFQIIFLAFFITFQWLFIGWTAKTIARAIQPKSD